MDGTQSLVTQQMEALCKFPSRYFYPLLENWPVITENLWYEVVKQCPPVMLLMFCASIERDPDRALGSPLPLHFCFMSAYMGFYVRLEMEKFPFQK